MDKECQTEGAVMVEVPVQAHPGTADASTQTGKYLSPLSFSFVFQHLIGEDNLWCSIMCCG